MKSVNCATDAELVERYRSGDNASFGIILERYKSSVYSYIRSLTNGNYSLTEEIFQETFIKLVMAIRDNQYEDTGKMQSWLCTAAYRLLIDNYRKEQTGHIDYVEEIFDTSFADYWDDSFEDKLVKEQELKDAVSLIDFLPVEQQIVLRLRIFDDKSFKEIAEQTDVSINTALGRMRYALINMRRLAAEHHVFSK